MAFFSRNFRVPGVDDKRCAYAVYLVDMAKAALPQRIGEKYFFAIGQIFERLTSQRRRQTDLHAFAFPVGSRLSEARIKDRSRHGRDLDQM